MREQNCCLLKIWKHFRKDKHGSLVIYFTPFQSHLSLYYSLIPTFVLSSSVNPTEPDYLCYQYSLCVKSLQSCPTLCDLMDCSPPGSSVHGILQAGILGWVAISSSRGSSWPRDLTHISCISCIGRRILYHYTTWEALNSHKNLWIRRPENSPRFVHIHSLPSARVLLRLFVRNLGCVIAVTSAWVNYSYRDKEQMLTTGWFLSVLHGMWKSEWSH